MPDSCAMVGSTCYGVCNTCAVGCTYHHPSLCVLLHILCAAAHATCLVCAAVLMLICPSTVSACCWALCFKLLHLDESMYAHAAQNNGFLEMNVCIDVLRVISLLAVRLIEDGRHVNAVGMCISLLAKMVECAPSLVIKSVLSSNIFGTANPKFSSGGLLFSVRFFRFS
ncbi:hypothetical protein HPP92_005013 [Vanilla planifolia]|uniref:Uncharacterized protein n=1 Tax=Vanilla planifolia TaxID=51239 RepID=A0A835RG10_VANPL|nr:hypothetical protein HPP92_005013 [Vanilla planifolia]